MQWSGSNSKICRVLQQTISIAQPNNRWRPISDLSTLETFLNTESFKMETKDNKNLLTGRGVGYLHRFQMCILTYTNTQSVQEVHAFSRPGLVIPVQSTTFGLSIAPMEFTVVAKEVKLMALQRVIRIHQHLDDWLMTARSHITCLQHTQTLVVLFRELGWLLNKEKSELDPKQVFNFVGYQFDLKFKARPTLELWHALTTKI